VEILFDDIQLEDSLARVVELIDPIQDMAKFPGGQDSLICCLERHWDKSRFLDFQQEGRVLIQFTIDTLGQMIDLKVNPEEIVKGVTHISFVTDDQILDEIKNSFANLPAWSPAESSGIKIKSRYLFFLKFPYDFKCNL